MSPAPVLPVLDAAELRDEAAPAHVEQRDTVFAGRVWHVDRDEVVLAEGAHVTRDVLRHPGAVGVVALDELDRLVVVQQYRHPVGAHLWELPAGLRDVADEDPQVTAARELAEEAGVAAARWEPLLDLHPTAGGSDELIRLFLATGLTPVAAPDGYRAEGEEASLRPALVPLDEAVDAVLGGRVRNGALIAGVLAVLARRTRAADPSRTPAAGPPRG